MKKLACMLLAAAMLAACAPALAQTDIIALRDANMALNVLDVYPSIVQRSVFYDIETGAVTDGLDAYCSYSPDAGTTYAYIYANGDTSVYGGGEGYGYIAEAKAPYIMGFLMDDYYMTMIECGQQNMGEFGEAQAIVAEETLPDGKLRITTEGVIGENDVDYVSDFAGLTLVARYTVNPESLLIEAGEVYIRGTDGVEKLYATSTLEIEPVLELPFDADALKNPEALWEVHVISDKGTDAEFDHVFEAPQNALMVIYPPAGYKLYADEACTEEIITIAPDGSGESPAVRTVYLKHVDGE